MKKLISAYVLVFACCFMLFIYEPIMMYATNINDFWFDLGIMIGPVLKIFGIIFLIGCLAFTLIYFINHKLSKEVKVYHIILLIVAIGFFASYIQGNYFIYRLPALDGSTIDWSGYLGQNIYTIMIWLALIILTIFMTKKMKLEKTVKIMSFVSLAVCAMLSTSLISTLLTTDATKNKEGCYVTKENINTISNNENFLIFMLDAVDEGDFYRVWQGNDEYKNVFEDFTYYRDAMSTYAFTRESVPFILTNSWNKNEEEFGTYSSKAYNQSPLFQSLNDRDYQINIYEDQLTWNGNRSFDVENIASSKNANIDEFMFFKQETKYILFKYLPYVLKPYSKIESMNFDNCIEKFQSGNDLVYNSFIDNPNLNKIDTKVFQFLHAEGGHVPFDYDKDMNRIENGTYEQKLEAVITMIKTYLKRLKENGVYDNSVIIILADHGYGGPTILNRFNPFLMIKGINERHETIISDSPVSYTDLNEAYVDLLNKKPSTDLFQDVESNRERTLIWYEFTKEDHMVEYTTTGTAKDTDGFVETGNVYDR